MNKRYRKCEQVITNLAWLLSRSARRPPPPVLFSGGPFYFPHIRLAQPQIVSASAVLIINIQNLLQQEMSLVTSEKKFVQHVNIVGERLKGSELGTCVFYAMFGFGMIGGTSKSALDPEYWNRFVYLLLKQQFVMLSNGKLHLWGGDGVLIRTLFGKPVL